MVLQALGSNGEAIGDDLDARLKNGALGAATARHNGGGVWWVFVGSRCG